MKPEHSRLSPPDLPGLTWRPLTIDDLPSIVTLARLCLRSDGGLPFLFEPDFLQSRYFPDAPAVANGAFDSAGQLAACAAVHSDFAATPPRLIIVGLVRPDLRRRGLGDYLMRWSQAQAPALLASAPEGPRLLQIQTESLTEPADRLYQAHGFKQVFAELVMQRDFDQPLADRPLPAGVTLATWQPDLAEQFYQAYYHAFRERPGFPGWSAAEWIEHVTENDLKPCWTLLARQSGVPVGFVIGNIDLTADPPRGYVWQIGVIPAQRRRGISSALLVETMRRMQIDGAVCAQLVVNLNNPGAIQAYLRLDFKDIGRRARYERSA